MNPAQDEVADLEDDSDFLQLQNENIITEARNCRRIVNNSRYNDLSRLVRICIVTAMVGAGLLMVATPYFNSFETVVVTVHDKERVTKGEHSYWLVYTDSEVFRNSDNIFVGKFNSADVQGRLERNKRYRLEVHGWRVYALSMYRNIISAQEVK